MASTNTVTQRSRGVAACCCSRSTDAAINEVRFRDEFLHRVSARARHITRRAAHLASEAEKSARTDCRMSSSVSNQCTVRNERSGGTKLGNEPGMMVHTNASTLLAALATVGLLLPSNSFKNEHSAKLRSAVTLPEMVNDAMALHS